MIYLTEYRRCFPFFILDDIRMPGSIGLDATGESSLSGDSFFVCRVICQVFTTRFVRFSRQTKRFFSEKWRRTVDQKIEVLENYCDE